MSRLIGSWCYAEEKAPNPPSYFFLPFDFVHANLTGVLTQTQLQSGSEEKVGKASLEGNMKMIRAVVLATKSVPYHRGKV